MKQITLMEKIPNESKLLVAVSGGPDSVYLLCRLLEIREEKNLILVLAHYNHGVRGERADRDEQFVVGLAEKYQLELKLERRMSDCGCSEAKMRRDRYDFLERVRQEKNCDYILAAHTLDDQIETIVFNFIRGTGLNGLVGMSWQSGFILRPILDTPKSQVLQYLQEKKIMFCWDESNMNIDYTRNYIRQIVIPQIEKLNPNYRQTIEQLSGMVAGQQDYIEKRTRKVLEKITKFSICPLEKWEEVVGWERQMADPVLIELDLKKYNLEHHFLRTNILYFLLGPLVPESKQITYKQIAEIDDILKNSRGGSKKLLFNTLSVEKKNGKITVYKSKGK